MDKREVLSNLYGELVEALEADNPKEALDQITKQYGQKDVLWMLRIITEDKELGESYGGMEIKT